MNHDMSFHVCIYMCVCVKYVYQEVQSMSMSGPFLQETPSLAKPSQAPSPATSVRDPPSFSWLRK